jgi:hypothetical protein
MQPVCISSTLFWQEQVVSDQNILFRMDLNIFPKFYFGAVVHRAKADGRDSAFEIRDVSNDFFEKSEG